MTNITSDDQMAGALMDIIRQFRNDERLELLPTGSSQRQTLIKQHLNEIATYHGVDRQALLKEVIRVLDKR